MIPITLFGGVGGAGSEEEHIKYWCRCRSGFWISLSPRPDSDMEEEEDTESGPELLSLSVSWSVNNVSESQCEDMNSFYSEMRSLSFFYYFNTSQNSSEKKQHIIICQYC